MAGAILIVGLVAAGFLVAYLVERSRSRRAVVTARREYREAQALANEAVRGADATQKAVRALHAHSLLTQKRCRSCGERKDIEEVEPVEDGEGRPIEMCKECRELIGE